MSRTEIVDKSIKKEVEYKAGDKVRIVANTTFHSYEIGEEVFLLKSPKDRGGSQWSSSRSLDGKAVARGYLKPEEFELVEENSKPKSPLKEEISLTLNKQSSNFNQQEEVKTMSNANRKTVTVNLIDRDPALDEKHALVFSFGEFTTSKSPEALIRSIIMEPANKVAELIAQHNDVRTKQTNKEILNRTGNKVSLEPVEESDLYWEIQ